MAMPFRSIKCEVLGKAHAVLGYMDAESEGSPLGADDFTRYMVGFGYEYPLSKRTLVYADAGYFKDEYDSPLPTADREPDAYQAAVGLVHYF